MRRLLAGVRALGLDAALVLATAAAIGALTFAVAERLVPHLYPLDLGRARWIFTADRSPIAYFSREIYVAQPIKDAWVALASGESNFKLRVNGTIVGESWSLERNASGVYDLAPYLKVGKNLLALNVRSANYRESARAAVAGGYVDSSGREVDIVSDGTWFAASRFDAQANLAIPWYDPRFVQRGASASVGEGASPETLPFVPVPASLFSLRAPPWRTAPAPGVASAVFTGEFDLGTRYRGVWVRIASPDSYALVLNGVRLFGRPNPAVGIEIHDIAHYVRNGTNTVDVRVSSPGSLPRVALDVVVNKPGRAEAFVAAVPALLVQTSEGRPVAAGSAHAPEARSATYGGPQWGQAPLPKKVVGDPVPLPWLVPFFARIAFFALLVFAVALADWLLQGILIRSVDRALTLHDALRRDAILRLPVLLFLGTIYVLGFDVRFDPGFPYRLRWVAVAVLLLFVLRAVHLVAVLLSRRREPERLEGAVAKAPGMVARWAPRIVALACLFVITLSGAFLRADMAKSHSFGHDEISMVRFAESIEQYGYAARDIGPVRKLLTTYELLPYPISWSIAALGRTEPAARMPAIVFAVLTTLLIFHIGATTWGFPAGLLAAAIHAFSPFSIYWGSNAFHPQQAQFFALLTVYLFRRAFGTGPGPVRTAPLWGATISFCLTYLTWEGSGLLLPAVLLCVLIQRGRDFAWLRRPSVWLAGAAAAAVVVTQLARRSLDSHAYLAVGSSIATSAVGLGFLLTTYNPLMYVRAFLLPSHHVLLTLLLLLGLPLALRDRDMQYYLVVLAVVLVALTNFVTPESPRYSYFVQPLLLLPASAFVFRGLDHLGPWQQTPLLVRAIRTTFVLALAVLVFVSSNSLILRLERMGVQGDRLQPDITPEVGGLDYKSVAEFVRSERRPGDVVIALMPHALMYYGGLTPDYYLQTYTSRVVIYDASATTPRYMDRFVGMPVLRSERELLDVLLRHRRVWILATPAAAFDGSNDSQTLDFVNRHAPVVFETYGMRVYRWER